MAKYRFSGSNDIIIRDDGAFIPADMNNRDYQEYIDWTRTNATDPFVPHVDTPIEAASKSLQSSDAFMSRALEVLIDVLIDKGTIAASDFPFALRTLYQSRKGQRKLVGVP